MEKEGNKMKSKALSYLDFSRVVVTNRHGFSSELRVASLENIIYFLYKLRVGLNSAIM